MLSKEQRALVKDFIDECNADNVPADQLSWEVSNFVYALGNQARDNSIRNLSSDLEAIKSLIKDLYAEASK